MLAQVAEQAVEPGVAAAGEPRGLARERAVGVALGRSRGRGEMLLDRREVAAATGPVSALGGPERERVLHRREHERRERLERHVEHVAASRST